MTQNKKKEAFVIAMTDTPLPSSGATGDCMQVSSWCFSLSDTTECWVNQVKGEAKYCPLKCVLANSLRSEACHQQQ